MVALSWDAVGERFYETGVDHGVLYTPDATGDYVSGVAWNGLVSVQETPGGAEANPQYADNIKYLNLLSAETFAATLEAFTFPDEWAQHDGMSMPALQPGLSIGQQGRKPFGLVYRTLLGNDVEGTDYAYKLHLVYGCLATPSEKAYNTVNDSPEAITFSWEITTTPAPVTGYKPTSLLVVDSSTTPPAKMTALEEQLFGAAAITPNLPTPTEVITLLT